MRILVTNDDGINAPGLEVLEHIARDLAGPDGEVWTVAPAFEQSGVGHCISYTRPMMIAKLSDHRYATEGSPADCVLAAIYDVLDGAKPDLILSGVNRGNNAAENVLYSGTIGAAMEGALQGVPAIALSQFFGPEMEGMSNPFEAARVHGPAIVRSLWEKGLWDDADYRIFYNGTRSRPRGFAAIRPFPLKPCIPRMAAAICGSRAGHSRPRPCPAPMPP
jgi:5'-nucleotidase